MTVPHLVAREAQPGWQAIQTLKAGIIHCPTRFESCRLRGALKHPKQRASGSFRSRKVDHAKHRGANVGRRRGDIDECARMGKRVGKEGISCGLLLLTRGSPWRSGSGGAPPLLPLRGRQNAPAGLLMALRGCVHLGQVAWGGILANSGGFVELNAPRKRQLSKRVGQ
jgi:hypothetical protein